MTITSSPATTEEMIEVEFPYPPTDLPYDDGVPLETPRHRAAMNLLINSLDHYWHDRNDYFVGGNMFLYYSTAQVKNQDFRGPDFFVALGVDRSRPRKYWAIWDEGGKYPDVIIELMSDSTRKIDTTAKKEIYQHIFKLADYFVYDPYDKESLMGWHLNEHQRYEPIGKDERGWLWCESLQLWLGLWEGEYQREWAVWLRFYDPAGNLVLLDNEDMAIKLEQERIRAEQQQQRAEQERIRAEQERIRAEQERIRADRLAAQLRALGIEPEGG
jgi:Uma2 family endonuclease